jgi:hypothetical protein
VSQGLINAVLDFKNNKATVYMNYTKVRYYEKKILISRLSSADDLGIGGIIFSELHDRVHLLQGHYENEDYK